MKIAYRFDSAGLCESALITHAHSAEQRLERAFPNADISVSWAPGATYSIECDDKKAAKQVQELLRSSHRFTFEYQPLLTAMAALAGFKETSND